MTGADVIDVGKDAIYTLLVVAGPILGIGLAIGLVVAFFQALTQIQEMTLTFVPKIIAVFASLILMLPFMGMAMQGLMERLVERIVGG